MDDVGLSLDRRRMLTVLASSSTLALAGCSGGDDGGDGGSPTPDDAVPAAYETATALNGQQRDPDSLSTQSAVEYQEQPNSGEQCSGCAYYIEDRNGDGTGACAIVEGTIEPNGWCVSYTASEAGTATPGEETPTDGMDADGDVEPVSVPEDASCAVCNMKAGMDRFADWRGQAVHEDDTRAYFCTAGCATTYYAVTEQFAETDAAIAGLWVTDFETGERIDGMAAHYALETNGDCVEDPMMVNPAPFASREDAVAYVDAVDYLTTEDVVELSAFDRELAVQYRGELLER